MEYETTVELTMEGTTRGLNPCPTLPADCGTRRMEVVAFLPLV